ncbi:MAG: hypothetical protein AAF624_18490 [Bacteroidota bacterium]
MVFLVGALAAPHSRAQPGTDLQVSVGPVFTLTGLGLSGNVRVAPRFSASAEFSWLPFPSIEAEIEDLDYDLGPNAYSILLLGHYHPGAGNFALGVGVMFGGYTLEGVATPKEPVEIGGTTYQPEALGEVIPNPEASLRLVANFEAGFGCVRMQRGCPIRASTCEGVHV